MTQLCGKRRIYQKRTAWVTAGRPGSGMAAASRDAKRQAAKPNAHLCLNLTHRVEGMEEMSGKETNWYALKVFYNRTQQTADRISELCEETYVPMQTIVTKSDGRQIRTQRPAVSSLLFIRATEENALNAERILTGQAMLYKHNSRENHKVPTRIDDREMDIFRLVVSSGADGLEFMPDTAERFTQGQKVRVTAGPLAGAEGHIARIRGDRRLVVTVHGICAVATAYIPQCFLESMT